METKILARLTRKWKKINIFENITALCSGLLNAYPNSLNTPDRRQSKTILTIDKRGSKSLETVFSIAICRQSGDKWQWKTRFSIFYLLLSTVLTFSIAAYPVCWSISGIHGLKIRWRLTDLQCIIGIKRILFPINRWVVYPFSDHWNFP